MSSLPDSSPRKLDAPASPLSAPVSKSDYEPVWVVVHEIPFEPSTVMGVYATEQLATLGADHPYDRLTVMEFPLIKPRAVAP